MSNFFDEVARGLVLYGVTSNVKYAHVIQGIFVTVGVAGSGEISVHIDVDEEMLAESLFGLVDSVACVETETAEEELIKGRHCLEVESALSKRYSEQTRCDGGK